MRRSLHEATLRFEIGFRISHRGCPDQTLSANVDYLVWGLHYPIVTFL